LIERLAALRRHCAGQTPDSQLILCTFFGQTLNLCKNVAIKFLLIVLKDHQSLLQIDVIHTF
jgi:hypothetical protein